MSTPPSPDAPAPSHTTEPERALTENQAFTRAWLLFIVLFAVVLALLWANKNWFS